MPGNEWKWYIILIIVFSKLFWNDISTSIAFDENNKLINVNGKLDMKDEGTKGGEGF